jgi:hypothetical protein
VRYSLPKLPLLDTAAGETDSKSEHNGKHKNGEIPFSETTPCKVLYPVPESERNGEPKTSEQPF